MPWAVFDDVSVDLDTIEVKEFTCHKELIVKACGRVASNDGRIDRFYCTFLKDPVFLKRLLERKQKQILYDECSDADNPELCEEVLEDSAYEMACEQLTLEEVNENLDRGIIAEALVEQVIDVIQKTENPSKKNLLDYLHASKKR